MMTTAATPANDDRLPCPTTTTEKCRDQQQMPEVDVVMTTGESQWRDIPLLPMVTTEPMVMSPVENAGQMSNYSYYGYHYAYYGCGVAKRDDDRQADFEKPENIVDIDRTSNETTNDILSSTTVAPTFGEASFALSGEATFGTFTFAPDMIAPDEAASRRPCREYDYDDRTTSTITTTRAVPPLDCHRDYPQDDSDYDTSTTFSLDLDQLVGDYFAPCETTTRPCRTNNNDEGDYGTKEKAAEPCYVGVDSTTTTTQQIQFTEYRVQLHDDKDTPTKCHGGKGRSGKGRSTDSPSFEMLPRIADAEDIVRPDAPRAIVLKTNRTGREYGSDYDEETASENAASKEKEESKKERPCPRPAAPRVHAEQEESPTPCVSEDRGLRIGSTVQIGGLINDDGLNGQWGDIEATDATAGRWLVRLHDGQLLGVKQENVFEQREPELEVSNLLNSMRSERPCAAHPGGGASNNAGGFQQGDGTLEAELQEYLTMSHRVIPHGGSAPGAAVFGIRQANVLAPTPTDMFTSNAELRSALSSGSVGDIIRNTMAR
jgi:hypothetical protein